MPEMYPEQLQIFVKVQQGDLQSSLFSYLFSHSDENHTDMSTGPNKVRTGCVCNSQSRTLILANESGLHQSVITAPHKDPLGILAHTTYYTIALDAWEEGKIDSFIAPSNLFLPPMT